MGGEADRKQVRRRRFARAAASPRSCANSGVRPYGVVRIDSACGPATGRKTPRAIRRRSPRPSARPRDIAEGSRRAPGRRGRNLLGRHALLATHGPTARNGRPPRDRSASRPTWPTRCSTRSATTPPKTRILPAELRLEGPVASSTTRCKKLTDALRPWTIDFHVAQNDATVHGTGSHDKTGRHCLRRPTRTASSTSPNTPATGSATTTASSTEASPPHLLGRLHVPQRSHDEAANVERHPRRDDQSPRPTRLE